MAAGNATLADYRADALAEHQKRSECASRTRECPFCHEMVPSSRFPFHLAEDCETVLTERGDA